MNINWYPMNRLWAVDIINNKIVSKIDAENKIENSIPVPPEVTAREDALLKVATSKTLKDALIVAKKNKIKEYRHEMAMQKRAQSREALASFIKKAGLDLDEMNRRGDNIIKMIIKIKDSYEGSKEKFL